MSAGAYHILAGASGQGGGYNLTGSLRFRSSASAYLSRTLGTPTDSDVWTFSFWVKRGSLGSVQEIITSSNGTSNQCSIQFNSSDQLRILNYIGSSFKTQYVTTQVFRDPSSWYHIVVRQNSSSGFFLYVNGTQVTSFGTATGPDASDWLINQSGRTVNIGREQLGGVNYFDGYLTEVNFIDGQALTPSSFGQTSSTTGVWQPKKYSGTYGTNGFYLPFTDNSALTSGSNAGLGKDFSGNGNYWNTNNISITSGSTYDSMTDVPTLTSATQANFPTLNPLWVTDSGAGTLSNANLNFTQSAGVVYGNTFATMGMPAIGTAGKYYFECVFTYGILTDVNQGVGVWNASSTTDYAGVWPKNSSSITIRSGSQTATGVAYSYNTIVQVAVDCATGSIWFGFNNSWISGSPSAGTSPTYSNLTSGAVYVPGVSTYSYSTSGFVNFGQRPFAYTPPTGFVALNTFNLPTPTIGATASSQAGKYFNPVLYTGNGSSKTVSGVGFQPDLVWIKDRITSGNNHNLWDSVRGAGNALFSNLTSQELQDTDMTGFNSDGFTFSGVAWDSNTNGQSYVAWNWKANGTGVTNTAGSITSTVSANTTSGFSIVTWTSNGNGSATVGHGLGVTPKIVIYKDRAAASDWYFFTTIFGSSSDFLRLNTTDAISTSSNSITSTTFNNWFGNTNNLVAYCFAEVAGFSKFGSYTGNGSSDGTFVYTGFRPRYVMFKRTNTTEEWAIYDTARDVYNTAELELFANSSSAEYDGNRYVDILSNGFKLRSVGAANNASGSTYIYMAFAENPFKYSLAR